MCGLDVAVSPSGSILTQTSQYFLLCDNCGPYIYDLNLLFPPIDGDGYVPTLHWHWLIKGKPQYISWLLFFYEEFE